MLLTHTIQETAFEVWKDIEGFESYYQISNFGNVRSLKNDRITLLKQVVNYKGYAKVCLNHDKKVFNRIVHRMVSIAFIDNPENKPQVNHIDGNKLNNHVSNLEWNTATT